MPQKILRATKRVFTHTCIAFTLLVLLVFVIGSAVPEFGNAIDLKNILTLLLFSVLFACANLLLHVERLPIALRVLLHFLATALTFYVVFVLIATKASGPSAILVMLLLYTIVYALLMGIYLFCYFAFFKKKAEEKPTYERIYR